LGDELCNGFDDDGDGLVDEDAGSCMERFLFVPICWQNQDLPGIVAAMDRWLDFFEEKSLISQCGHEATSGRKIDSSLLPPSLLGCPGTDSLDTLTQMVREAGVDLRNFDVVSFVAPVSTNTCAAGFTSADGLVFLETGSQHQGFNGEYATFAHEFGHIIGLGEEYRLDSGKPNTVNAALECDPVTCCVNPHACSSLDGDLCLGNRASDATGWSWAPATGGSTIVGPQGQTGLFPPFHADGSRCIMSNASAPGWDAVQDPATGQGSHRAWCAACLERYRQVGPKCIDTFSGARRRLEASGHVDANGNVFVTYYNIDVGRVGSGQPSQSGPTDVQVHDQAGNLLIQFAPAAAHAEPSDGVSDKLAFWLRHPTDMPTGPVTFSSYQDGVFVSQVTAGGSAPIAIVPDVVVECAGATTQVVIDGSASYDPDGDTLYYSWSSPVQLQLSDTDSPDGDFPLGTTPVSVIVSDGTGAAAGAEAEVSVVDTTPPTVQLSSNSVVRSCNSDPASVVFPVPAGSDACAQATVQGELIAVHGRTLSSPVALGPSGSAVVGPGLATVRWTAIDPSGNTSSFTQSFTVQVQQDSACCSPGQTLLLGNGASNQLIGSGAQSFCVLGYGLDDQLVTASGSDTLLGGDGADHLNGYAGANLMFGGNGVDMLNCGPGGSMEGHGEAGDDVVQALYCTSSVLWGGLGSDAITGSSGADTIYPGVGQDYVYAAEGSDTVVLFDGCEATLGKVLDGGPGSDTLVTPVPLATLTSLGVTVTGFESIVVDAARGYLASCF
jgi:hypothetical protein